MRIVCTIKYARRNETRVIYADDERDFQRVIERILAEPGVIGFGRQSTTYGYRP